MPHSGATSTTAFQQTTPMIRTMNSFFPNTVVAPSEIYGTLSFPRKFSHQEELTPNYVFKKQEIRDRTHSFKKQIFLDRKMSKFSLYSDENEEEGRASS